MTGGAYGKYGVARTYALIFGIAYLSVAAMEAVAQHGLKPVLDFTGLQNGVHWAVGSVVLLSFFAGEATAKMMSRIAGMVFLAITVWGVASPSGVGDFLGYSGNIPVSYNFVHALTGAAALYAGFATQSSIAASA